MSVEARDESQSTSHSTSHSTSSSSLYLTPMNSPMSSLSDMLSLSSTTIDFTYSSAETPDTEPRHTSDRCRLLSSASVSSDSTIKCSTSDNVVRNASTHSTTISDHNSYNNYNLLLKYLKELEVEQTELVGIEQKINLISLQCKMIREKSMSKTNALYAMIEHMSNKCAIETNDAQTQTQTSDDRSLTLTKSSFANKLKLNSYQSIEVNRKQINILHKDLSPLIKHKFRRLPALIKGYLVRRLMKTEKVANTLQTIYDTTQLLVNFKLDTNSREITNEDINLHKRLIIQLDNACSCYYDIFINYPKKSQMAIISQSRENLLSRHFRNNSALSTTSQTIFQTTAESSLSNGLSSVTRKKLKNKIAAKIDSNRTYSCEPKTEYIRPQVKKVLSKSTMETRRSKRFIEKKFKV